jgi:pimeloyl-ACP methyl ester carboxylesterase
MTKSTLLSRLRSFTIVNAIVCGIVGVTFGLMSNAPLPWLIGGALVGALLGALTETLFNRVRSHARLYRMRMVIAVLIEVLLIIYLVLPIYAAYSEVHPARLPLLVTPADLGLSYEDIQLTTQDGLTLAAWYIPSHNGATIIAVHGFGGNRTHVVYHAHALAQHGYGILALDMRAHGASGGDRFNPWTSDLDVLAAVDYVRHRPGAQANRIAALGLSAGSVAALYAAARDDDIQAVWVDGPAESRVEDAINPFLPDIAPFWFMTPMVWNTDRFTELFSGTRAAPPLREQVKRIAPRSVYFVAAGQAQGEISIAHRYADNIGPTAQVWELPDATHCNGIFSHSIDYQQRMMAFFDANLTTP